MSQKRLQDQMAALEHIRAKCEWLEQNTEGMIQEEMGLMGSQINSVIEMLCYIKIPEDKAEG